LGPARILAEDRGSYLVATDEGEQRAQVGGRFRFEAGDDPAAFPAVGDWVAVDGAGSGVIQGVVPRRTAIVRLASGRRTVAQVVGANVDVVFVVASLNHDLNPRRLERYLAVAWESGAEPVIVLSKADLADDLADSIAEVDRIAVGVRIITASAVDGRGVARSGRSSSPARPSRSSARRASASRRCSTSSPARRWRGQRDPRGRREGPATRRLAPAAPAAGRRHRPRHARHARARAVGRGRRLERSFADIEALAAVCRFGDCAHDAEPGCAVTAAIRDGDLNASGSTAGGSSSARPATSSAASTRSPAPRSGASGRSVHKSVGKHMELKYGREADDRHRVRHRRPAIPGLRFRHFAGPRTTPAWPAPTWPPGATRAWTRPSRSTRSRTSTRTSRTPTATAIS
jgi:ribosome biogenesis GTPase